MHTASLLTVSQHVLRWGMSASGPGRGVSASGLGRGVYPSMQWGRHPPRGQTDTQFPLWCLFSTAVCNTNCHNLNSAPMSLSRSGLPLAAEAVEITFACSWPYS